MKALKQKMTLIMVSYIMALLLCMNLTVLAIPGNSAAILVSGGDFDDTVMHWRKDNINNTEKKFKEVGIKTCLKAFDKETLKGHLNQVKKDLKAGDTLVLYFNGHGQDKKEGEPQKFLFQGGGKEDLEIRELHNWLSDGELNAGVHIYIAFYSCYSGDHINMLRENPRVALALSSSGKNMTTRRQGLYDSLFGDFVVKLNWADGFERGLETGGSLAEIFVRAAKNAREYAMATNDVKSKPFDDKPMVFLRGVVEKSERINWDRREYKLTLTVGGEEMHVITPSDVSTNIHSNLNAFRLEKGMDVEIFGRATGATFTRDGLYYLHDKMDNKKVVTVTRLSASFRVLEVKDENNGKLLVHFENPAALGSMGPQVLECIIYAKPLPANTVPDQVYSCDLRREEYPIIRLVATNLKKK